MRLRHFSRPLVNRRRGITLTEILVVISLIGMMAGLSTLTFRSAEQFAIRIDNDAKNAMARVKEGQQKGLRPEKKSSQSVPALHSGRNLLSSGPYPVMRSPRPNFAGYVAAPLPTLDGARLAKLLDKDIWAAWRKGDYVPRIDWNHAFAAAIAGSSTMLQAPTEQGNDIVWRAYAPSSAFSLHSRPGASQVIYMDFNGHTTTAGVQWNTDANGGNPITSLPWSMDADRTSFSTIERDRIILMWRMVAEDFMPFDVNVTTEDPGVDALRYSGVGDTFWGMRVIIGPVPTVSNTPFLTTDGGGGVAYGSTFKQAVDICCWVFNGDVSTTGATPPEYSLPTTVSHEVGHTLGLGHDGTATLTYYPGHGTGVNRWGPIMGSAYASPAEPRILDQWAMNTSYPGGTNVEDDLLKISGSLGYRTDDYGDAITAATPLNGTAQATLTTTYGIIERNTDADFFVFYCDPGTINIQIDPLSYGANLDVSAELLNSSGTTLVPSALGTTISATISTTITAAGVYYVKVTGSNLAAPAPGYPKYGSLGNYRISGNVIPMQPPDLSFRLINPQRWNYNRSTQTYDGYVLVANETTTTFNGTYTFGLTMPSGVVASCSAGFQSGNIFLLSHSGTLAPSQRVRFYFRLSNPQDVPLRTGINNYLTSVSVGP